MVVELGRDKSGKRVNVIFSERIMKRFLWLQELIL